MIGIRRRSIFLLLQVGTDLRFEHWTMVDQQESKSPPESRGGFSVLLVECMSVAVGSNLAICSDAFG